MKHTPIPWEVGEKLGDYWDTIAIHPDIAHVHADNSEANAEFLVRAVNSHEDLKKALEDVELRCTQARIASDIGNESGLKKAGFLRGELERIGKAAREALNKAEGTTSGV